jgi:hypothetical protein
LQQPTFLFCNFLQKGLAKNKAVVMNFPMAFFWQLLVAGPVVRKVFGMIFNERKSKVMTEAA